MSTRGTLQFEKQPSCHLLREATRGCLALHRTSSPPPAAPWPLSLLPGEWRRPRRRSTRGAVVHNTFLLPLLLSLHPCSFDSVVFFATGVLLASHEGPDPIVPPLDLPFLAPDLASHPFLHLGEAWRWFFKPCQSRVAPGSLELRCPSAWLWPERRRPSRLPASPVAT